MSIEFRILGPLEVSADGRVLPLGSPKQRALLALLLIRTNETVSRDRLIEELWGDAAPASVESAFHSYLSRLRRLLDSAGGGALLVREAHGYRLRVEPDQLDATRFAALAGEGSEALAAGDAKRATDRLRQALALWRGPALADLESERFAIAAAARLDEERVSALEQRLEADLALARHREMIGELETLVAEHPYRERLRAQLMLALYRSGRQAEALRAYQQARRTLADELGLEPGSELRELEQAILSQDPTLTLEPRAKAQSEPQPSAAVPPLASIAAPREERKVVTVLFADLVGFTAQAEPLDPEDVRAIQDRYWAPVRAEIERHGGAVEKFVGDAVMALFGAPRAHEDDPERGVRAALAIRDWAREQEQLEVRIAVTTGEALVRLGAQPLAGEGVAAGDVINSAARLEAAAPVNGILVGETTYRATRHVVDYREAEAVETKGKTNPIPAWEAIAPRSELGVQAGRTALIGRHQELSLLLNAVQRVRDDREPQLVTLVGVPGIGKSRLTFELFSALAADNAVVWRQGRCLPYGDGIAFGALGEIVKSHAQIFASDAAERTEEKLGRAIAAAVPDASEAEWIARHLRPLVGIGAEEHVFRRDSQADVFAAWRRFLEALADQDPLVLVFEDLHWADEQLLDFLDHLAEWAADIPLLVLCTARPELLERRPGWGGGKANTTTLSLRPLSDEETARLLAANLAHPLLDAEAQSALLERAGGNPLFAEQYARMLAEREDTNELSVPETVQAIIAARLDGLSVEDKELLHNGAVHGTVFWSGAVAAMSGDDRSIVERRLHGLERKEFVRRQRRSAVAGEAEYAFRHMLVRDVAYGQIPRRVRGEKHGLAAEWIDAIVEDRDDHVELLAGHYGRALELVHAVGGDDSLIAERARPAFGEAGKRAWTLGAFSAAERFYRQALDLTPEDSRARPRLRLDLARSRLQAGEAGEEEALAARDALLELGDIESAALAEATLCGFALERPDGAAAATHAERALELARDLPPSRAKLEVLASVSGLHFMRGDLERALVETNELRVIAEELGTDDEIASSVSYIGMVRIELGDIGGVADVEQALGMARENRSPFASAFALTLAAILYDLGPLDRAFGLVAEAHADVTRAGFRSLIHYADVLHLREQYWTGNWDDAVRIADKTIATEARERFTVRRRAVRSQIRLARGRVQEALDDTVEALNLGRNIGDWLQPALAVRARASLAAGARAEALGAVDELLERFAGEGSRQLSATLPDFAIAAVELGRADAFRQAIATIKKPTPWIDAARAFADGDFTAAAATYTQIGSLPDAAYAQLRAAKALVESGHPVEADEPLHDALAFYRSVGATRYIREGEQLLTATNAAGGQQPI
jgi:DNA-binding SARP family transcriptional activator